MPLLDGRQGDHYIRHAKREVAHTPIQGKKKIDPGMRGVVIHQSRPVLAQRLSNPSAAAEVELNVPRPERLNLVSGKL
jgi:hypothetical protein